MSVPDFVATSCHSPVQHEKASGRSPGAKPRALIIAYAFPPCGGAGIQRTVKTVQYLGRQGWAVSVLTVKASCYGIEDASYELGSPFRVVRTGCFDPVVQFGRQADAGPVEGRRSVDRHDARRRWRRMAARMWMVFERHLLVPDRFILWYPLAVRTALRMYRQSPFDVVYATGEPYSAFLIARRISRSLRLPFVLDMRDPWTLVPYRAEQSGWCRAVLERWQERRVLHACAACIFANSAVDAYAEKYPQFQDKFHRISNGYDPTDFVGVQPRRFDRFTIVHNGTFLPGYRTADTFLNALRQFVDEEPATRTRLQVLLVGKTGAERELSARLGLADVVKHLGYRPHRESLEYVTGADALLLVGGPHRWEETGKIFEYLAAAKPILALVEPEGAAAHLLKRCPVATVVPHDSVQGTLTALRNVLMATRRSHANPTWLVDYERQNLAARVEAVLESAVASSAHASRAGATTVRRAHMTVGRQL